MFFPQLLMEQLTKLLLGDDVIVQQSLQDQLLLFFPGGVRPK
jgi:hypothetical protein